MLRSVPPGRVSKHGHEHRACCRSFETRSGVYPEVFEGAAPHDAVVRVDLKRKDPKRRRYLTVGQGRDGRRESQTLTLSIYFFIVSKRSGVGTDRTALCTT